MWLYEFNNFVICEKDIPKPDNGQPNYDVVTIWNLWFNRCLVSSNQQHRTQRIKCITLKPLNVDYNERYILHMSSLLEKSNRDIENSDKGTS